MLHVENLSIKYPNKDLSALKSVNFKLPKNSFCFITGGSGAGITTLCLAIAGVLKHARPEAEIFGTIRWNGKIIDQSVFNPGIGITLENPYSQFSGLKRTVIEEMVFGLEMRGLNQDEMKERIKLTSEIFNISHLLQNDLKILSGGETQKVVLASSYILLPELWILDRPLTELDPLARHNFLKNLQRMTDEKGTTIIIGEEPAQDIYNIATHLLTVDKKSVELSLNKKRNTVDLFNNYPFSSKIAFSKIWTNPPQDQSSLLKPVVEVKDLSYRYSTNQPILLENMNIVVHPGECLFITGPNGCGKTTFAKIVAGLLKTKNGKVIVNGILSNMEPIWKVAQQVGYAFQNPDMQIFSKSVWDEISFGPRTLGYAKDRCNKLANKAIKLLGLTEKMKCHPHDLNRSERKRLGIASTLSMDTPIIILDEPTQFQDVKHKQLISKAMKELLSKGKSIICITHNLWLTQQF